MTFLQKAASRVSERAGMSTRAQGTKYLPDSAIVTLAEQPACSCVMAPSAGGCWTVQERILRMMKGVVLTSSVRMIPGCCKG